MNWDDYYRKAYGDEPNQPDWQSKRDELMQRQMEALRSMFSYPPPIPAPRKPVEHRTPSPTHAYESLDHFLFQPEIHWNGQTVADDA